MRESSRRPGKARAGIMVATAAACLCAGQLISAPAAGAAGATSVATSASTAKAAAANAAAANLAVAPAVSGTNSRPKLPWGSASTLRIFVKDPSTGKPAGAGQVVKLQSYSYATRSWSTRASKRLYDNGYNWFSVKPKGTTSYRIVFAGGDGYAAGATGSLWVRVVPSGAKVLAEAKKHVGRPYRFAAVGPRAFDCSGFTKYVYRKAAGKNLPHKANSQQRLGRAVSKSNARPGDLIVIRSGSYGTHVGVYAGGGYMYDSPRAGKTVGKHKIWSRNYVVRRIV